jgi:hypothetical protein
MATTYRFELDEHDLGHLLDGLEQRVEPWERTVAYLRTETMPDGEFFLIEECRRPEEADAIAAHFRRILHTFRTQMEAQR